MTADLAPSSAIAESEPWRPPSARERLAILNRTRTIAMVGASSNPARASHFVATYLLSSSTDYIVWFVNPRETSILGHPVYPALARLSRGPRHLVDVFRRVEELPGRGRRRRGGRGPDVLGPARTVERRGGANSPTRPGCRWS